MTQVTSPIGTNTLVSPMWGRGLLSGVLGSIAGMAVSGSLLIAIGPFTIFNEALQSPKVMAVWDTLEPLPLISSNPVAFAGVLVILGAVHGLVFALVARGLPKSHIRRGLLYGLVIWLMSYLFFELNGPFALLGEPPFLVGVELATGAVGALIEGTVISAVYGRAQGWKQGGSSRLSNR